jgi:hypothetical protein
MQRIPQTLAFYMIHLGQFNFCAVRILRENKTMSIASMDLAYRDFVEFRTRLNESSDAIIILIHG